MLNKKYKTKKNSTLIYLFLIFIFVILFYLFSNCSNTNEIKTINLNSTDITNSPLIFIGGYARSGTTLMRSILDVHPDVSCEPETEILTIMTRFIHDYLTSPKIVESLNKAGIRKENLNTALAIFIHQILENRVRYAERFCGKDEKLLYYMEYLYEILPNAKFIYMVRDGRDVAWSLIQNKNDSLMAKFKNYLNTWNLFNADINEKCKRIGVDRCLMVKYEDLTLYPKESLVKLTEFLGLEWSDDLLNQKKLTHSSSINKWVGNVNPDKDYLAKFVNMLQVFGYDTEL